MSPGKRIFLNVAATYGRSLYALVVGLFCARWVLMSLGEVGKELCFRNGVVHFRLEGTGRAFTSF